MASFFQHSTLSGAILAADDPISSRDTAVFEPLDGGIYFLAVSNKRSSFLLSSIIFIVSLVQPAEGRYGRINKMAVATPCAT